MEKLTNDELLKQVVIDDITRRAFTNSLTREKSRILRQIDRLKGIRDTMKPDEREELEDRLTIVNQAIDRL